ncbi:glycoside hydrolase family 2 TIM barrel-domain containing protein [Escherichia coli]|uniref:glycoside hydrolase family 2 TIM barrel-domain containing protein n=1 Tax=Escherichia coli TaxID=562 RepID=UPI002A2DF95E|nr:hypothetical protein [Salmonella enterica]EIE2802308.1 hypothetical protein [Salmonella enterica]HCJ4750059.1 hypothetical protein [Salmonella enterica]
MSYLSVQWSEEYQLEYLEQQHIAFDSCDAIIGEQMWNFADFQTWEGIIRMDGNKKGAFTRNRQPKMSAHYLKKRWSQIPDQKQLIISDSAKWHLNRHSLGQSVIE